MILTTMYRCLQRRGHKYSPDHRVDVDLQHIVSRLTTKCLSYVRVDFRKMDIVKLWWNNLVPLGFIVVSATSFPVLELGKTSDCHVWELDAAFSVESLAASFHVLVRSKFELFDLSVPGLWDSLEPSAVGYRSTVFDTKFQICWFFFLYLPFRHGLRRADWAENSEMQTATCPSCWTNGENSSRVKLPFCQDVCELVFWYQRIWFLGTNWFRQTTNQMQLCESATRVSSWDFAFYYHLVYCFVVFKCKAKRRSEKVFAFEVTWSTLINLRSSPLVCFFVLVLVRFLDCSLSRKFPWTDWLQEECNTALSVRGGIPVTAPLCCGRLSPQGCSDCRKTDSGKGQEGVPVRGVRFCKVYDIARWGVNVFWAKRRQCASWLEPCKCMEVNVWLYTLATSKNKSVQQLSWENVVRGRCVCLHSPSITKRLNFRQSKWHLWKKKNYCSVQDDVCHESQLRFWFNVMTTSVIPFDRPKIVSGFTAIRHCV